MANEVPEHPPARDAEQTLHLERSAIQPVPVPLAAAAPADPTDGSQRTTVIGTVQAAPVVVSLTIRSGPDTGARFTVVTSPIYIGRAPDNGIVVNDPATSRRHARFERRGQDILVIDLGSANGTLVDGVRVVEQVLAGGSVITMGQNEFVVSVT